MKTKILAVLAIFAVFAACRKDVRTATFLPNGVHSRSLDPATDTLRADSTTSVPFPQFTSASSCPLLPIYGDTIAYPQPTIVSDYSIRPVNDPGAGTYFCWPAGLALSSSTGVIDLTQSQMGMRYAIGFVRAGTNDTCISYLTLGGASYLDSVYLVNSGGIFASPYFDSNPSDTNTCNSGSGNGSGCKFDVTGSAAAMRVVVNNSSGKIDLKNTLYGNNTVGGVFGLSPIDGQTVTVPIYYQVKKGSNNALQLINVQFIYFESEASLNAALLTTIAGRSFNLYNGSIMSTSMSPRPPLVIMTKR